jgi:hypothetical protein
MWKEEMELRQRRKVGWRKRQIGKLLEKEEHLGIQGDKHENV